MRLRDIRAEDVEAFVRGMEDAGLRYANMRTHTVALKVLFATACVRDKLIPSNPAHDVSLEAAAPDDHVTALTEEELRLLLAAIPGQHRSFFVFLRKPSYASQRYAACAEKTWSLAATARTSKCAVRLEWGDLPQLSPHLRIHPVRARA